MFQIKPLTIGDLVAKYPIIQGGMGVGISLSSLAGSVAKAGGVGIISAAQIGYRDSDFQKEPLVSNLKAMQEELKKAREIAPNGIIGFNIMVATKQYALYVKEAVKAGADLIISGAGLPINLPELVKDSATKIAPIVSSVKSAMVILKMWDRKYRRIPDLVVIEGPLAGGHLGFSPEQIEEYTSNESKYDDEIRRIIHLVKEYEETYQQGIPIVVGGGIYTNADFKRIMELGADGVQVGTRFVTTKECDAPLNYKNTYINAEKADIVITKSPVGMPGRAIKNTFLETVSSGQKPPKKCYSCLGHCNPSTTPYCITEALINAVDGKLDEALLFCGSNAYRSKTIERVEDVINDIVGEK